MADRSAAAYGHYRDASQRFDLFMAGLCGAVIAYVAKDFRPCRIGVNPGTLELVALALLLGALYASLARIQQVVLTLLLDVERVSAEETRGAIATAPPGSVAVDRSTGNVLSPAEMEHAFAFQSTKHDLVVGALGKASRAAGVAHSARNILLLLGFVSLLAARVWGAYAQTAIQPKPTGGASPAVAAAVQDLFLPWGASCIHQAVRSVPGPAWARPAPARPAGDACVRQNWGEVA